MVEEIKYCSGAMKKNFNKKLVMTKEDHEDFDNCAKYWICDSAYVDGDVKVWNHCDIKIQREVLRIEIVISMLN